jgi:hypothetical protein
MKSRRNKNAGKHPSYVERGMSDASIKKKRKRDKEIAARPEQKKKRAECNAANRDAKKKNKSTTGKDASHTSKGIVFKSVKSNRGSKSDSPGDRRSRGGNKKNK